MHEVIEKLESMKDIVNDIIKKSNIAQANTLVLESGKQVPDEVGDMEADFRFKKDLWFTKKEFEI
jgi:hypothetical protein